MSFRLQTEYMISSTYIDGMVMKYTTLCNRQWNSSGCRHAAITIWPISNIRNTADGDKIPSWTILIATPTITAIIIMPYAALIIAATITWYTVVNVSCYLWSRGPIFGFVTGTSDTSRMLGEITVPYLFAAGRAIRIVEHSVSGDCKIAITFRMSDSALSEGRQFSVHLFYRLFFLSYLHY